MENMERDGWPGQDPPFCSPCSCPGESAIKFASQVRDLLSEQITATACLPAGAAICVDFALAYHWRSCWLHYCKRIARLAQLGYVSS